MKKEIKKLKPVYYDSFEKPKKVELWGDKRLRLKINEIIDKINNLQNQ